MIVAMYTVEIAVDVYKRQVGGHCHGDDHDYRQFPARFCNGGTGRKNVLSPRLHENLCAGLCFRIGIDLAADLILYIVFGTDRLKADTESAQLHTDCSRCPLVCPVQ